VAQKSAALAQNFMISMAAISILLARWKGFDSLIVKDIETHSSNKHDYPCEFEMKRNFTENVFTLEEVYYKFKTKSTNFLTTRNEFTKQNWGEVKAKGYQLVLPMFFNRIRKIACSLRRFNDFGILCYPL
jgi:hypothetical protein